MLALVFIDNGGMTRMKCVSIERAEDAAEHGVGWSELWGLSLSDDSFAHPPDLYSPSGDIRLRADLDAAAPIGGAPGWGWAPIDHHRQSGEPWPGCQRWFLRRMTAAAAERGLEIKAAWELEWVAGADGPSGFEPLHTWPRLRCRDVRRDRLLPPRAGRRARGVEDRARPGASRVLRRPDGALASRTRRPRRLRRVDPRAPRHPHGGWKPGLAHELLAAGRRRLGRKRRAPARQRLGGRRESAHRRGRARRGSGRRGRRSWPGFWISSRRLRRSGIPRRCRTHASYRRTGPGRMRAGETRIARRPCASRAPAGRPLPGRLTSSGSRWTAPPIPTLRWAV